MKSLKSTGKLIVGISSRALFDLSESHQIFENDGIETYSKYQIDHENVTLKPGPAFSLVKKLLSLVDPKTNESLVEVILVSRNSADTGLRIFNSIQEYQLNITKAAFTKGESPYHYISAFSSHLFLSANTEDVRNALQAGCAAATILPTYASMNSHEQLRIAFDGDAVIFSDESERIYQQGGLEAFTANEKAEAKKPLSGGPFKGFLTALQTIQSKFPAENSPIRTALITARSAPAHERVILTLRAWNIRIDEALFLGGLDKGEFLKAFEADIFFDDQQGHCQSASQHVATGHVPHGIINES
ncbi:MAG: 5'-nucleotidase [Proteobacteria bacterium]|nr:5'-nucleotidase [Pseudomonadota bacterium]